jgi:hypothetical protein
MVLAALAPAAALPLYYWRVFSFVPLWRRTLMTDPERPHVVTIVTCYGLLCGGVFVVWYRYRRSLHRPHVPLLVLWIVVTAILVLSPLPQPNRYLLGLTIPLALLCAYAVLAMPKRARLPSLVLLCVSSVATICTLLWIALGHRYSGYYLDAGGTKIVAYLAMHTTAADVILGPERLCDIAVGVTPARVVLGHYYETPNVLQMRRATAIYDAPSTSARARALFEAAHHVTVIIEATDQSPVLPLLTFSSRYRHVYSSHGYSIFMIVPKASAP